MREVGQNQVKTEGDSPLSESSPPAAAYNYPAITAIFNRTSLQKTRRLHQPPGALGFRLSKVSKFSKNTWDEIGRSLKPATGPARGSGWSRCAAWNLWKSLGRRTGKMVRNWPMFKDPGRPSETWRTVVLSGSFLARVINKLKPWREAGKPFIQQEALCSGASLVRLHDNRWVQHGGLSARWGAPPEASLTVTAADEADSSGSLLHPCGRLRSRMWNQPRAHFSFIFQIQSILPVLATCSASSLGSTSSDAHLDFIHAVALSYPYLYVIFK